MIVALINTVLDMVRRRESKRDQTNQFIAKLTTEGGSIINAIQQLY